MDGVWVVAGKLAWYLPCSSSSCEAGAIIAQHQRGDFFTVFPLLAELAGVRNKFISKERNEFGPANISVSSRSQKTIGTRSPQTRDTTTCLNFELGMPKIYWSEV
jgi:hypothetical protein